MTYITRLFHGETISGSRIMAMALVVLGMIAMQSRPVRAQWTTNGNNINNTNTGNVGIGTTTPEVNLDVAGNFKWGAVRHYRTSRSWGANTNDWAEIGSFANTGVSQYALFTVQGHWCGSIISAQFRYDDIAYTGSSSNWLELPLSNGGKVYSGTQPVAIDVKRASPGSTSDPFLARIRNLHGMCGGTSLSLDIESNTIYTGTSNTGTGGTVDAGYAASDAGWKFPVTTDAHAASTNGLFILNTGNVGIGTTSPRGQFSLNNQVDQTSALLTYSAPSGGNNGQNILNGYYSNVDGLYSRYFDIAATGSPDGTYGGSVIRFLTNPATSNAPAAERVRIDRSGNVGIGTTSPSSYLAAGNGLAVGGPGARNQLTVFGAQTGSDGAFADLNFFNNGVRLSTILSYRIGADNSSELAFFTTNAGSFGERVRIDKSGNVGIGTPTPISSYKLDVNGNTNVTGNLNATGTITGTTIYAKYQDVAEWVESSQALAAGTVVVLDHTRSNQVIASSQAYDTRVAGVISLQPGITLGESGAGKVLVATTGRVKIKVDATAGPIQIGDLLVTSDKEGVAMKSQTLNIGGAQIHRPGTLVGKALEPLAKGTGEILVLLSLQ